MTQQPHSWAYTQRKPSFQKAHAPHRSLQHCLQQPGPGSSLNVHQQRNGRRRFATHLQWNIPQPRKGTKQRHVCRCGETWRPSYSNRQKSKRRIKSLVRGHQSKTQFSPQTVPPIRKLCKPLILIHQRADRMKTTITEN